jgi:clan AA aspartic protease (TIGR02281 family)
MFISILSIVNKVMRKLFLFFFIFFSKVSYSQVTITMEKYAGVYMIPCKVNGLKLKFVFDTGASDVSISLTEAIFMLKNGFLNESDIGNRINYSMANGDISQGTIINLKELEIGGIKLYNVKASIAHELSAPLLLGQSVISRLGKIQMDGNKLTILNSYYKNPEKVIAKTGTKPLPKPLPRLLPIHSENKDNKKIDNSVPKLITPITKKVIKKPVIITPYSNINNVGAKISMLNKIDELIDSAINIKAFPGCRVVAVKEGKVFYDRSFGFFTFEKDIKVNSNTIYDLANVTMVLGTTLAIMKLYEQGKIDLFKSLGDYIPEIRNTNKSKILIKDLLLHQSGLKSWIPFYKETIDEHKIQKREILRNKKNDRFNITVAQDLFMNHDFIDSMWNQIYNSPLGLNEYNYSDLGFILLKKVVENASKMKIENYLQKEFYNPLRVNSICYNPIEKGIDLINIAPTEIDEYWRHSKVQGSTLDVTAAMFGGVAGHSGLFSNANDIAIILQMLLNGGVYRNKKYLELSTIEFFTTYKNSTRRGYGWDKPEPNIYKNNVTADNCSLSTFGASGFTGVSIFADPANDLQFIFLCNRTYPRADNKLLKTLSLPIRIQKLIYESLDINIIR